MPRDRDARVADEVPAQIGVRLQPEARAALQRHTDDHGYALAVNAILTAYDELVRRDRPKLAPNEWRAILDVLNGSGGWLLDTWRYGGSGIALSLHDSEADGTREKWDLSPQRWRALIGAAKGWTFGEALAVLSVAQRFWARCQETTAARVTAAGGDPNAVPGEPGWRE